MSTCCPQAFPQGVDKVIHRAVDNFSVFGSDRFWTKSLRDFCQISAKSFGGGAKFFFFAAGPFRLAKQNILHGNRSEYGGRWLPGWFGVSTLPVVCVVWSLCRDATRPSINDLGSPCGSSLCVDTRVLSALVGRNVASWLPAIAARCRGLARSCFPAQWTLCTCQCSGCGCRFGVGLAGLAEKGRGGVPPGGI